MLKTINYFCAFYCPSLYRKRIAKANFIISFTFENTISDSKLRSIETHDHVLFYGFKINFVPSKSAIKDIVHYEPPCLMSLVKRTFIII